jgi:hypothetical protein
MIFRRCDFCKKELDKSELLFNKILQAIHTDGIDRCDDCCRFGFRCDICDNLVIDKDRELGASYFEEKVCSDCGPKHYKKGLKNGKK